MGIDTIEKLEESMNEKIFHDNTKAINTKYLESISYIYEKYNDSSDLVGLSVVQTLNVIGNILRIYFIVMDRIEKQTEFKNEFLEDLIKYIRDKFLTNKI